jgi:hypothetical protein
MELPAENDQPHSPQWTLIRDLAVLQFKLLVDGFRDLVLLPASIIAAVVSFVKSKDGKPGPQFYNLLAVGKQSELWINLFGALKSAPDDLDHSATFGGADIDDIVSKVEKFVVSEYKRGGVTAQAKSRIDQALRNLHDKNRTASEPGGSDADGSDS